GEAPASAPAGGDHTVAVGGFANITGRPEGAWLGTGLAESGSAGRASVPGLVVVARGRVLEALRELGLPAGRDEPARAGRGGGEGRRQRRLPGARRARAGDRAALRDGERPRAAPPPGRRRARGDLRAAGPAGRRDHRGAAPKAARARRTPRGDAEPASV